MNSRYVNFMNSSNALLFFFFFFLSIFLIDYMILADESSCSIKFKSHCFFFSGC